MQVDVAYPEFFRDRKDVRIGRGRGPHEFNMWWGGGIPHVAAFTCKLYEPWMFFPSFPKTKTAMVIRKGEILAKCWTLQRVVPAESTERLIMGGEAERKLGFCIQRGSAGSPVPLSAAAARSSREGKEDAQGTSEPAPALLFEDHLVHFHPLWVRWGRKLNIPILLNCKLHLRKTLRNPIMLYSVVEGEIQFHGQNEGLRAGRTEFCSCLIHLHGSRCSS